MKLLGTPLIMMVITVIYLQMKCEWLESGEVLWEAKSVDDKGRKVTSKRIAPEGWDNYDVIADYTHETKMVSYIFRKKNTFVV